MALVCERSHFEDEFKALAADPETHIQETFWTRKHMHENIQVGLMSRTFCEHDSNYLQIIPYVVLINKNNPNEIYTYIRGGSGDETRLHGKCSVGLGGHIEEAPSGHIKLNDILIKCINRELYEEVKFDLEEDENYLVADELDEIISSGSAAYMYSASTIDPNDVGQVHLALVIKLHVNPSSLGGSEENVITYGKFTDIKELKKMHHDGTITLEPWSARVLYEDEQVV